MTHDQYFLKDCFCYDAKDGVLYWKKRPDHHFKSPSYAERWNKRLAGTMAGTIQKPNNKFGYKRIKIIINNKPYMAHRLIWLMFNGDIPDDMFIDHIDGNPTNNRIDNLRLVTHSQNHRNRNPKSELQGVRERHGRWQARVKICGKEHHIGMFDSAEEAKKARYEYAKRYGFTKKHLAV